MRIVYLLLSILILIIHPNKCLGQSADGKSAEDMLLQHHLRDTVRVDLLNAAADAMQNVAPEKAYRYLSEAGEIAVEVNYDKGRADYLTQMALYYYVSSEFEKVLEYTNKSLTINKQIGDEKGAAKNYYYIGKINYFQGNVDQAIDYLNKALKIQIALKDSTAICYTYASLGTNYADIGKYDLALEYEKDALEIAYNIRDDKTISFALNNLGVVYELHGNWPKALECYQKSLLIDERQNNYKDAAVAASNVANILKTQGNFTEALEHCEKGLAYSRKVGYKTGLCYNYEYMAHIYAAQQNYTKAWEYQQKTLSLQKEIGNQQGVVIGYRDLADILVLQNNYDEASDFYHKAIKLSQNISYKRIEVSSYIGLSKINFKLGKHQTAYYFSQKANKMAVAIDNIELISQSSEALARSCENLGKYKEAYHAHTTFKTMSDSLHNEANVRRISGLEHEYKAEKEKALLQLEQQKKDRLQAAELKKQKLFRNTFIIAFVFMILLALNIWRGLVEKKKANKLLFAKNLEIKKQAEELIKTNQSLKQLSRFKEDMTNMLIHDLKNPLSTMIHVDILSEVTNKDELVKHLAFKMLNMIENTLDLYKHESVELVVNKEKNDLNTIINSAVEEVDFLAKFNQLSFNISQDHSFEVNADLIVVRRIFVNILSNAVKFSSQNNVISIHTKPLENNTLKVIIHNNGSYIDVNQQKYIFEKFGQLKSEANNKMHSTGLGLNYCVLAVEAHNGKIGVESSKEKGTSFWFTLPEAKLVTNTEVAEI